MSQMIVKDKNNHKHHILETEDGHLVTKDGTSHSHLQHIMENTEFVNSRLSNIQDWIGTQGGDGSGTKTAVMIDSISSSNNTISERVEFVNSRLSNIQDRLIGAQTSANVATIVENSYFNAQQATQSVSINAGANGNSATYNLQTHNKVSVIIKETLNTPAVGAYAILEWSDNDDVFVSQGSRVAFASSTRADGATSLGFWATFEAQPVTAKYMRVGVYNGSASSHTYDIDVNFIH